MKVSFITVYYSDYQHDEVFLTIQFGRYLGESFEPKNIKIIREGKKLQKYFSTSRNSGKKERTKNKDQSCI